MIKFPKFLYGIKPLLMDITLDYFVGEGIYRVVIDTFIDNPARYVQAVDYYEVRRIESGITIAFSMPLCFDIPHIDRGFALLINVDNIPCNLDPIIFFGLDTTQLLVDHPTIKDLVPYDRYVEMFN